MPAYVLKSDKDTVFSFRIVISPDLSAEGFKKNEIIYESNTFFTIHNETFNDKVKQSCFI